MIIKLLPGVTWLTYDIVVCCPLYHWVVINHANLLDYNGPTFLPLLYIGSFFTGLGWDGMDKWSCYVAELLPGPLRGLFVGISA